MLPINKKITLVNFSNSSLTRVKYIVIHFVGAVSTAKNNADYFYNKYVGASAHYFTDEKSIWQIVEDKNDAWHVGIPKGSTYKHAYCRNSNSIGIEMCVKKDSKGNWYFEPETIKNTIELTSYLMKLYNIPIQNVVRHFDVTGKDCPSPFVKNLSSWQSFKNELVEEEIDMEELKKIQIKVNAMDKELKDLTKTYDYVEDCPSWSTTVISSLVKKGYIKGDTSGKLGLHYSDIRLLVMLDRAKAFE